MSASAVTVVVAFSWRLAIGNSRRWYAARFWTGRDLEGVWEGGTSGRSSPVSVGWMARSMTSTSMVAHTALRGGTKLLDWLLLVMFASRKESCVFSGLEG